MDLGSVATMQPLACAYFMTDKIELIRQRAVAVRATLERARDAEADIQWISRFPEACCNFAANLLIIQLSAIGIRGLRRMIGAIRDDDGNDIASHVWVVVDGSILVDITADSHGLDNVIVASQSGWHASLCDVRPFIERIDHEDGISEGEVQRLQNLYKDTLCVLEEFK